MEPIWWWCVARIYVTFSGSAFDRTTEKIYGYYGRLGADVLRVYDDSWLIESGFVEQHKWLWDSTYKPHGIAHAGHGFGHCCWKPFIILDAMKRAQPGDLILYTDADTYPVADMSPLFEICEREGMVIFEEQGCINRNWIKRDCFIRTGCDDKFYWDAKHACGRFQLFKVTDWVVTFVRMWADYATDRACQLHDTGAAENLPEFKRHSTEQAVLTLLAHRSGVPLHRTPDQNGWPISPNCGQVGDTYPQIFKQEWCAGDRSNLSGSRFRNV